MAISRTAAKHRLLIPDGSEISPSLGLTFFPAGHRERLNAAEGIIDVWWTRRRTKRRKSPGVNLKPPNNKKYRLKMQQLLYAAALWPPSGNTTALQLQKCTVPLRDQSSQFDPYQNRCYCSNQSILTFI